MSTADDLHIAVTPAHTVFLIARREFVIRVRSKTFRIGTVLIVLLLTGYVVLQVRVLNKRSVTSVGFTGPAQVLAQPVRATSAALGLDIALRHIANQAQGEGQVQGGHLDVLVSGAPASPDVLVKSQLNATLRATLIGLARQEALAAQLTAHGLDPRTVETAVARATIQVHSLAPPNPHRTQQKVIGLIVGAILYISLMIYGNLVAQGVIEEKASRIVEILLATVRPGQLLVGKLVGIGLVGLLQLAIIGVAGLLLIARTHVVTIPALGAGVIAGGLLWFVLGFVLYAVLYAAAGSLVSRQEDAQMVTLPISMALILAYVAGLSVVLSDPSSLVGTVLSLLPPLAPVLMPTRMATGDASVWQVVLAILLTLITIGAATWLAARIYANSVLRTGARITLGEALHGR